MESEVGFELSHVNVPAGESLTEGAELLGYKDPIASSCMVVFFISCVSVYMDWARLLDVC